MALRPPPRQDTFSHPSTQPCMTTLARHRPRRTCPSPALSSAPARRIQPRPHFSPRDTRLPRCASQVRIAGPRDAPRAPRPTVLAACETTTNFDAATQHTHAPAVPDLRFVARHLRERGALRRRTACARRLLARAQGALLSQGGRALRLGCAAAAAVTRALRRCGVRVLRGTLQQPPPRRCGVEACSPLTMLRR